MKRDGCPLSEAAKWWYNVTAMKLHITDVHYTPIQLKMPLEIERIIEVNDPVYTFHEVILNEMNAGLETQGVKLGTRSAYAIEYVELLLEK